MRVGVRLGVDVGSVRVGIARSDALGQMAIPLETIKRDYRGRDIARIAKLAKDREAIEIVIGLPRHLKGVEGRTAKEVRKFAVLVQKRLPKVRVCLLDERLSSSQAHLRLTEAGVASRKQRQVVDQVAAQIILDQALALERETGQLPGTDNIVLEQNEFDSASGTSERIISE